MHPQGVVCKQTSEFHIDKQPDMQQNWIYRHNHMWNKNILFNENPGANVFFEGAGPVYERYVGDLY